MISHHIVAAYALARQQSLLDEARHDHQVDQAHVSGPRRRRSGRRRSHKH
jgi:hypothetical protein